MPTSESRATSLRCPECGGRASHRQVQTLCSCGRPWLVDYELDDLDAEQWKVDLRCRPWSLRRYAELLPLEDIGQRVDLGEGITPLLALARVPVDGGRARLLMKQEAGNPTGSFKDRGLSLAINRARELEVKGVELPSAGNAGISAAAYAVAAGMRCRVAVPRPTPRRVLERCREYGVEIIVAGGTLVESGQHLAEDPRGYLSIATMREPYRVEGKKTLGFELAEQLDWRLPEWVVFPTGGGTGIVAMHKAFDELRRLGLVEHTPRLVAVQSDGCAPLVEAFQSGAEEASSWNSPSTSAWGLQVPQAVGDRLTLRALRESDGLALAVPEVEIAARGRRAMREHGVVVGPEGAAALLGADGLIASGQVIHGDTVVVFQTGHPANYQ